jgi:type I restriction enzyme S subunit
MKLETFFDNFEYFTDSPDGILKMQELILQLAVSGRLGTQNPKDEPATKLLEKIDAEKLQLFGKKHSKSLETSVSNDYPALPDGWLWIPLSEVFYPVSTSGKKIKTSEIKEKGKYPVVDQGQKFISGYVDDSALVVEISGPVIVFGDHTRALKYIDFNFVGGADGIKVLRPICIYEKYFYWILRSFHLDARGYGRHYKILVDNMLPLAPFAEQKRIVAKVEKLMAICDKLQTQLKESQEASAKLTAAAVSKLIAF